MSVTRGMIVEASIGCIFCAEEPVRRARCSIVDVRDVSPIRHVLDQNVCLSLREQSCPHMPEGSVTWVAEDLVSPVDAITLLGELS